MEDLIKLSSTCFVTADSTHAVVQSANNNLWYVIDKGSTTQYSKIVFGPDTREMCFTYLGEVKHV